MQTPTCRWKLLRPAHPLPGPAAQLWKPATLPDTLLQSSWQAREPTHHPCKEGVTRTWTQGQLIANRRDGNNSLIYPRSNCPFLKWDTRSLEGHGEVHEQISVSGSSGQEGSGRSLPQ